MQLGPSHRSTSATRWRAPLIGLDGGVTVNDVPVFGLSYVSDDGGATFNRRNDFNFRFSLRLAGEDGDDDDDHD